MAVLYLPENGKRMVIVIFSSCRHMDFIIPAGRESINWNLPIVCLILSAKYSNSFEIQLWFY